ncbi:hypothetical protein [Aquibacillus sediminis]|uniref:hypothetical protein n=1 Tax=Aquibacillus sediminis TaxID=2574734 RepID=UPI0011082586|nr:hypothetical protein [Aquibacillus sediminis]
MMEFLYFPEDKTSYIPSIISLIIIVIGAIVTMYMFKRLSKKEEEKVDHQYQLDRTSDYKDDT